MEFAKYWISQNEIQSHLTILFVEVEIQRDFACYESTDCHGAVVETVSEKGDCCERKGLSFTLEGSTVCQNCFSKCQVMSGNIL